MVYMQTVPRLIEQFTPNHYSLSLVLERIERRFSGTVTIEGVTTNGTITLHAKELTVASVLVDGSAASFRLSDNDELIIGNGNITAGNHIVVVTFSGDITNPMHGLYPCYFEHDGIKKELLATQFESHHAREVFPCIDEPEAKATFDVTLTTEQDVTVLGNMPTKQQVVENEKLVTSFETTPRMSPYLLAWVVGELHSKTATTKNGVTVNVWATPAQRPESLDFALDFATKTIDYYEDYFGVTYPLPKCDHVALPDFTSGAMENWGLITYREIALLADPQTATIDGKHYVATVISHELSHQWFGNLVTMKWWNNLWLNESFANFIENLPVDAMHPDWNIWMDYAMTWSLMALRRDAIDGVQAVQTDVNHPDEISTLFDGAIVYGKGGRLIGMLREYVGEADFKKGLKLYFETYQYSNTTGDDLWRCFESVSGKPVGEFMNSWILRPGYPIVHVEKDRLSQEQFFIGSHQPSDTIWPIPLRAEPSGDLPAVLDEEEIRVVTPETTRLNVGNWSHFLAHYNDTHFAALLEQLPNFSPLDRLQLINERALLARGDVISHASLLSLVSASTDETHEGVWSVLSLCIGELKKFVETDEQSQTSLKQFARHAADVQYQRLGWNAAETESENDIKLRPTILAHKIYGEDADVISEATRRYNLAGAVDKLDPELRSIILAAVVKDTISDNDFNRLLETYASSSSAEIQGDILGALSGVEDPDKIQRLLEKITDSSVVRPQDVSHWFAYLIRSRYARDDAWQWMKENWGWIEKSFAGDKSYDDYPRYAAGSLTTRAQLEDYIAFFESKKSVPSLTRVIELGIAEIEARVVLIERDGPAVRSALSEL